VLCAWALFAVAGVVLQKFSERWQRLTPVSARGLPAGAFEALVVAAAIGSALVLLGVACTLPRLVAYLRSGGWAAIRPAIVRAVTITALAAVGTVGLVAWAHRLGTAQRNGAILHMRLASSSGGSRCSRPWSPGQQPQL